MKGQDVYRVQIEGESYVVIACSYKDAEAVFTKENDCEMPPDIERIEKIGIVYATQD